MTGLKISRAEARKLILVAQGFSEHNSTASQILNHLGYVQIDTISVVERAHHHVFWSRNHKYRPRDLEDLIANREGFEYWSHAAAYLPMQDYRFTLPMKEGFRHRVSNWFPKNAEMESRVLDCIRLEGPKMSKDFENTSTTRSGWWDWKPAKKALERLFMEGRLEITARKGFQKVYDLPERVIPCSVNTSMPGENEYFRHLIDSCLRHHGVASAQEMAYLRPPKTKNGVKNELEKMLKSKEVIGVQIEDLPSQYFVLPDYERYLNSTKSTVAILSPFDNLVIQRKKLKDIFEFEYQIECYVPEPKRKFGYFSLPVLKDNQFVAQIDCKADRKSQVLFVKAFYTQGGVLPQTLLETLQPELMEFAAFNGCLAGIEHVWDQT